MKTHTRKALIAGLGLALLQGQAGTEPHGVLGRSCRD